MARLLQPENHTHLRTLLIVERPGTESPRLRELAAHAQFRVVSASSGHLVHSLVRRSAPDLILLAPDTGSPGASEIARGIKEDSETRAIPILHLVERRRFEELAARAYPTEGLLPDDAPDEELLKTMRVLTFRTSRVRYGSRTSAPLEGDLENDTFPDILQFLVVTAKTGTVTVNDARGHGAHSRNTGMICLEGGRVVHAQVSDLEGVAAFQRLCFTTHGYFRFEPGAAPPRRTMRSDGIELLLESARQRDVADRSAPWNDSPTVVSARTRVSKLSRTSRAVKEPELFESTFAADPPPSIAGSAAVVLLMSVLLLLALGVYVLRAG
jgi:hypothetical protein